MEGPQQVDAARHVYRFKALQRDFCVLLGVVFGVAGCALAITTAFQHQDDPMPTIALGVLLVAFGAYLLAVALRSSLVVDGTTIQVGGPFGSRSVDLNDVEGFRSIGSGRGASWQLLLRAGKGIFIIPSSFETDDAFLDWLRQVPDLDERDHNALLAKIEFEQEAGARLEDWLIKLAKAKRMAKGLFIVCVASSIIMNLVPDGLVLPFAVLVIAAPFLGAYLCWQSPALYGSFNKKGDSRAETIYSLIVAGFALLFRLRGLHLVSISPLIMFVVLVAVAMAVSNYQSTKRGGNQGAFVIILLLSGLYGYGAVMIANVYLDFSPVKRYSGEVISGYVVNGRSTSYVLHVGPWGPVDKDNDVSVPSAIYFSSPPGDIICFDVHPGRANAPWYHVVSCLDPITP